MKFKQYILLERLDKVKARQMIPDLKINPPSIPHKDCKLIYVPETKDLFTFSDGVGHFKTLDELKALGLKVDFNSVITITNDGGGKKNIWVSTLAWSEHGNEGLHGKSEMKRRIQIVKNIPQIAELIQDGYKVIYSKGD